MLTACFSKPQLTDLIDEILEPKSAKVIPYNPLLPPEMEDHTFTPRGKILFQYDPQHSTERVPGLECDVSMAASRIFVMENEDPVYADSWVLPQKPFQEILGRRGLQARQESDAAPACRRLSDASSAVSSSAVSEESTTTPSSSSSATTLSTLQTITSSTPAPGSAVSEDSTAQRTSTSASSPNSSPSISSCAMATSTLATTGPQSMTESVYCSCNGDQRASLSTTVDDDGYTIYTCDGKAMSTQAPSITSCALSTAEATTISGQELPETEMCDCNGRGQMAGVSKTVGPDMTTSWICEVDATPPVVAKTKDPAYSTGTCKSRSL